MSLEKTLAEMNRTHGCYYPQEGAALYHHAVQELIRNHSVVVEVGVHYGRSGTVLMNALERGNPSSHLFFVDPWGTYGSAVWTAFNLIRSGFCTWREAAIEAFWGYTAGPAVVEILNSKWAERGLPISGIPGDLTAGLSFLQAYARHRSAHNRIGLYACRSDQGAIAVRSALGENPSWRLSLVHIDTEHNAAQARVDCRAWLPILRPGGVVAFHDVARYDATGTRRVFPGFDEALEAELRGFKKVGQYETLGVWCKG